MAKGRGPEFGRGAGPLVRGGRRVAEQRLGPVARQQLQDAHRMHQEGRFGEAAAAHERLAGIARERSMSRMACHLAARAAVAHARAGDEAGLLRSVQAAMLDARTEADPQHAGRTFGDVVAGLEGTAFAAMAPRLEAAVRDALGVQPRAAAPAAAPLDPSTLNRSQRRHLPQDCEHCGGAVASVTIRWNDDGSADCPYCGCVLTA